jgi:hypothetical protein
MMENHRSESKLLASFHHLDSPCHPQIGQHRAWAQRGRRKLQGGGKEEKAAVVSCSIYVEHFGKGLSLGGGYSKGGGYSGGGGNGYDGGDILGHGGRFGKRQSGEDEDCVAHSGRIRTAATWATSEDSRANAAGASRTTTPRAVEPSIAK